MASKQKKIANTGISNWNYQDVPNLTGKNVFITGGNSGIGLEAAKELALKGANILFSSRSEEKAITAKEIILNQNSKATVDFVLLDLSDFETIGKAAYDIKTKMPLIDILINNAGIMMTPQTYTSDDHELQFATNHLGHFLLNSLLFDQVNPEDGRVVVVSSLVHKDGEIFFDDINLKQNYTPMKAYSQSKLANLLYAFELDRRLKKKGSQVKVVACHPGYSSTNLQSTGPTGIAKSLMKYTNKFLAQSARDGAMPTVFAATGDIISGAYYGPQNLMEFKGPVGDALVAAQARDEEVANKLWEQTEQMLNHQFAL